MRILGNGQQTAALTRFRHYAVGGAEQLMQAADRDRLAYETLDSASLATARHRATEQAEANRHKQPHRKLWTRRDDRRWRLVNGHGSGFVMPCRLAIVRRRLAAVFVSFRNEATLEIHREGNAAAVLCVFDDVAKALAGMFTEADKIASGDPTNCAGLANGFATLQTAVAELDAWLPMLASTIKPSQREPSVVGALARRLFFAMVRGDDAAKQLVGVVDGGTPSDREAAAVRIVRDMTAKGHKLDDVALMALADVLAICGPAGDTPRAQAGDDESKPMASTAEASPTNAELLAAIPALDKASRDWISGAKNLKAEAAADSLRAMRNSIKQGAIKSADGTHGIDKSGRKWRKESTNSQTVFYYRPSLKSTKLNPPNL